MPITAIPLHKPPKLSNLRIDTDLDMLGFNIDGVERITANDVEAREQTGLLINQLSSKPIHAVGDLYAYQDLCVSGALIAEVQPTAPDVGNVVAARSWPNLEYSATGATYSNCSPVFFVTRAGYIRLVWQHKTSAGAYYQVMKDETPVTSDEWQSTTDWKDMSVDISVAAATFIRIVGKYSTGNYLVRNVSIKVLNASAAWGLVNTFSETAAVPP